MLAASEGQKDAALALMEAGANVDLTTSAGATAYKLATVTGHYITAAAIDEATKNRKKQP
jgi:ankyrin repeat protein